MIDSIEERNKQSCNWKDYMCKYNIRLLIVELIYDAPHHSVTTLLCDMLQTKTAYILSSLALSYQDNQLGLSQLTSHVGLLEVFQ